MLAFNKNQLDFMMSIQAEDDWHPRYFLELIKERNGPAEEYQLSSCEYSALISTLKTYTLDQVRDLQLALDLLGGLPG